jgi:hypothetical protein
MYRRIPAWACDKYGEHGDHAVCERCQENFRANGSKTEYRDMPPRARFGRGWFSVGAVHWFEATDATVFPSRDGKRLLAAAFCGGICDVTIAWAPQAERECDKCIRALRKVGALS